MIARYYDWLSRYQRAAGWATRAGRGGNRGIRRWAGRGGAAVVLDALHGGLMLERLYRRGAMEYRLIVARR